MHSRLTRLLSLLRSLRLRDRSRTHCEPYQTQWQDFPCDNCQHLDVPQTVERDVASSLGAARNSWDYFVESQARFMQACTAFDWETAEIYRVQAIESLDSYMDNIAAAHKRLQPRRT